jgi:hypothetical protein
MHRRFFSVLSGAVDRGAASHGRSAGGHDPDSNYGGAPLVTLGEPISDTATLSGGDNPTGTITFTVYRPDDEDCSGDPAFTSDVDVNVYHNRLHYNDNALHKPHEKIVAERVIKETFPNKGRLANTGGMPLAKVAFLSLAIVGLGVSILRSAIRRER